MYKFRKSRNDVMLVEAELGLRSETAEIWSLIKVHLEMREVQLKLYLLLDLFEGGGVGVVSASAAALDGRLPQVGLFFM